MPDMVNHPSHYTAGGVECIEAIRAATGSQFTGYLWGNAMKYLVAPFRTREAPYKTS